MLQALGKLGDEPLKGFADSRRAWRAFLLLEFLEIPVDRRLGPRVRTAVSLRTNRQRNCAAAP